MRCTITKNNGNLKREIWDFELMSSFSKPDIYLESYVFQDRQSTRHTKWHTQTHWQRIDKRSNNIPCPNVPTEVESEMKQFFQLAIKNTPITL
jgi:hypothetical protein